MTFEFLDTRRGDSQVEGSDLISTLGPVRVVLEGGPKKKVLPSLLHSKETPTTGPHYVHPQEHWYRRRVRRVPPWSPTYHLTLNSPGYYGRLGDRGQRGHEGLIIVNLREN